MRAITANFFVSNSLHATQIDCRASGTPCPSEPVGSDCYHRQGLLGQDCLDECIGGVRGVRPSSWLMCGLRNFLSCFFCDFS